MKKFQIILISLFFVFFISVNSVSAIDAWQLVGSSGSGRTLGYNSLVFDSNNIPYVAYINTLNSNKLNVLKLNGNSWESVGDAAALSGVVGNYNISLAIDSNDMLYLAYRESTNKSSVIKWNGTDWELVGDAGFSAGEIDSISIALDSNDIPYVAYIDFTNNRKATVMKWNSTNSTWESLGVSGFSTGNADFTSIAIDSNDIPYVAYKDIANSSKATVVKWNSTNTTWENVGNPGFSAGDVNYFSFAMDSNDIPYVVYSDVESENKATVMKLNGATWENVGNPGFSAGNAIYNSIAIDSNNIPYVAYRDFVNNRSITVMKYNGTTWEGVGDPGFSGLVYYVSIVFDLNNIPHVLFRENSRTTVMKYDSVLVPTLTTNEAYNILTTQATIVGDITATGGINSTEAGFEYGETDSYGNTIIYTSNSIGVSNFSLGVTGLACGTTYHYRSYAINIAGTGYGPDATFTTADCTDFIQATYFSTPDSLALSPNDRISASAVAVDGSIFLAGYFAAVNENERNKIFKISSTGTLSDFAPSFNEAIKTMVISPDESTLYVGGCFSDISGEVRNGLASFNTSDGTLNDFNPNIGNGNGGCVYQIVFSSDGSKLYIGGDFEAVGENTRSRIASFDMTNPSLPVLTDFNSLNTIDSGVLTIALSENENILYIGGSFNNVNATQRYYLASLNIGDSSLTDFDPVPGSDVSNLLLSDDGSELFISGAFTTMGNSSYERPYFASFNTNDSSLTDFSINFNGGPYEGKQLALSPNGDNLFVGGTFNTVGVEPLSYIAEFRISDRKLTNFNPQLNEVPYTINFSPDGSKLYLGGNFTSVGSEGRSYFASFPLYVSTPSVDTTSTTLITKNSATLNANITDSGSENITERGFQYGRTISYGTTVSSSGSFGVGEYSKDVNGLDCGTAYHLRAYFINQSATTYGDDESFVTERCRTTTGSTMASRQNFLVQQNLSPAPTYTPPTLTPTASPISTNISKITRTLKQNTIGDDVKNLQKYLNEKGYTISLTGPGSAGNETTKFGPLTKKALIKFQLANKLTPDGIFGPKTREVMNGL